MSEIQYRLSVIVPCAATDSSWRGLLSDLQALPKDSEILLISPDPEPVQDVEYWRGQLVPQLRWIQSPDGRAACQNRGALEARGDYLWFLHGDSKVPRLSTFALLELIAEEENWEDVFFFDHHFLGDGPKLVFLNSAFVNFRSKYLSMPMGQQGFAMHKDTFQRIGGFDESIEAGEDHQLVWEARRKGIDLTRIPGTLFTSARRYRDGGWGFVTIDQAVKDSKYTLSGAIKLIKHKATDI